MNCEHHTLNPKTDNELICTPCSPKTPREQPANNSNQPIPSTGSHRLDEELFTAFSSKIPACEEVYVFRIHKNRAEIKKAAQAGGLCRCAKITAQDFCGAAAFFALTASFLRLM